MSETELIDFAELALKTAQLSPCQKRKVGAVVVGKNKQGLCYTTGFNHNPDGPCEDGSVTTSTVKHAEVMALERWFQENPDTQPEKLYVTFPPCGNCTDAYVSAGIAPEDVHIVGEFMKFDHGKPRMDLVPSSLNTAVARVLTYGARKYQPNNWRQGEVDRYLAALERHLAEYKASREYALLGHEDLAEQAAYDEESGLHHLAHIGCNVAFLLEMDSNFGLQKSLELKSK